MLSKAKIRSLAAELYSPDLPYHNFQHALKAIQAGQKIVRNCRRAGVPIDSDVVYYALLFHDAGYHEDHQAKGFATKEAYSAHLAQQTLRQVGLDRQTIKGVVQAIGATERDGNFETAEGKAVRAADLASIAGPYAEFLQSSLDLRREFEQASGTKVSWSQWQSRTEAVISFYISQDFSLAGRDQYFQKRARANLDRLLAEKLS
jgi:predicted metal-dependent HD superfamily phosphohydrolase